jgi:hypothetical protein
VAESVPVPTSDPPAPSGSLVGRSAEVRALHQALRRAKDGQSSSFLLVAQGGMGKTRLLRWLEHEARREGFQVLWGNGLKEAVAPFFVFEQILSSRRGGSAIAAVPGPTWQERAASLPSFQLFEEDRPRRLRQLLATVPSDRALLLASRDSPATLRDRGGGLPRHASSIWITRMEGEGKLSPANLDGLGEAVSRHLQAHPGSIVGVDGLEYLCSQNSFPPVLRLLQFLRDVAQDTEGHLLVSANPAAFEKREVSLLEAEAEVDRAPSAATVEPSAIPSGPETSSATLLRYLQQVETLCRASPLLVVVDDLHWADAQSSVAFQFLVRNVRDLPVLLVGAAREEEISHEADDQGISAFDRLRGLEGDGLLSRLALSPFGPEEGRSLAAQVLGGPLLDGPAEEEEIRELLKRTGGNPYFLQETLLQLREHGWIQPHGRGFEFRRPGGAKDLTTEVPTSLRRLVLQRLALLSREERALLDTAAVTGSEFPLEPVASVLGTSSAEALGRLRDLERRRRLIESIAPDGSAWSFSHPLVWEVAISEMSPTSRRRDAQALLGWWEEHRGEDISGLARLAHEAGDPVRGIPWIRQALAEALAAVAPEAAATYLLWLQELRQRAGGSAEPGRVLEELAGARRLSRQGGNRNARRFIEGMLGDRLSPELRWEATYSLAFVVDPVDAVEAPQILEKLRSELAHPEVPVPPRLGHAVNVLWADMLIHDGKDLEALPILRSALDAPEADVDPDVRVRALTLSIWSHNALAHRKEVEELLERGKRISRSDPSLMAQLLHMEAIVVGSQGGSLYRATQAARGAAAAYRKTGLLLQAGVNDFNAAEFLVEENHPDEAEEIGRDLLDSGRKFDIPRLRCSGAFILARVAGKRQQWKEALALAEESMRDAVLTKRRDDIFDCRLLFAVLRGESGDLGPAIDQFDEIDRAGFFSHLPRAVESLPIFADFLARAGQKDRARQVATRALAAATQTGNQDAEAKIRARLASWN